MKKRKIVILNTITVYEKSYDRYKMIKNKHLKYPKHLNHLKYLKYLNNNNKYKIYKPSFISLSDEEDIIIPYLHKTKSFKKALEGIKHVRMCNDLMENGPEAFDSDIDSD